jgi:hypothetical protein
MTHGDMANQSVNLWLDPPVIHNLEKIMCSIENILNQTFFFMFCIILWSKFFYRVEANVLQYESLSPSILYLL